MKDAMSPNTCSAQTHAMANSVVISASERPPYRFESPFGGGEYVLLLVVCSQDVSDEEQSMISQEIVRSGCRYALAYGHRCSTWDDSIDLAYISTGKLPEQFIMTTWHENEPLADVIDFWWWNTAFEDFVPERFCLFFLGTDPTLKDLAKSRIQHHSTRS